MAFKNEEIRELINEEISWEDYFDHIPESSFHDNWKNEVGEKEIENSAAVKMLLGIKRAWLVIKAENYKLDPSGTKLELARRIADHEERREKAAWKAISGASH